MAHICRCWKKFKFYNYYPIFVQTDYPHMLLNIIYEIINNEMINPFNQNDSIIQILYNNNQHHQHHHHQQHQQQYQQENHYNNLDFKNKTNQNKIYNKLNNINNINYSNNFIEQ